MVKSEYLIRSNHGSILCCLEHLRVLFNENVVLCDNLLKQMQQVLSIFNLDVTVLLHTLIVLHKH